MRKNNPISVYIERTLPVDSKLSLEKYFAEANRIGESEWTEFSNSHGRGYKQGKEFVATLDYESNSLEVKVWIEELDHAITISVGNSGFPFEPLLSKSRYTILADKICAFVQNEIDLLEASLSTKRNSRL